MFSVVMPAYNAERWIEAALESVVAQSCDDWEAIVVDDCSGDSTAAIVESFARRDSRVRLLSTEVNSGSAFAPRRAAIEAARGQFVVMLDADDFLDADYLSFLSERISSTGADVVLSTMVWEGDGSGRRLPLAAFDMTAVGCGRDLVRLTLDGWKIPATGAVERTLYLKALEAFEKFRSASGCGAMIDSDECLTRLWLSGARRVAFSTAVYHYRQTPGSVTRSLNLRSFERLRSQASLRALLMAAGFTDSDRELWDSVAAQEFHMLWGLMTAYSKNLEKLKASGEASAAYAELRRARKTIDFRTAWRVCDRRKVAALWMGTDFALTLIRLHGKH